MNKAKWIFDLGAVHHSVEVEHNYFFGRKIIHIDNKMIKTQFRLSDLLLSRSSVHSFLIEDYPCEIHIIRDGLKLYYQLFVNGELIDPTNFPPPESAAIALLDKAAILGAIELAGLAFFTLSTSAEKPLLYQFPLLAQMFILCFVPFSVGLGTVAMIVRLITWAYVKLSNDLGWWISCCLLFSILMVNLFFWAEVRDNNNSIGIVAVMFHYHVSFGAVAFLSIILISFIILAKFPVGGYYFVSPLAVIMLVLTVNFIEKFDSTEVLGEFGLKPGLGIYLSIPLILAYCLVVTVDGLRGDRNVPINTWIARLTYLGWYHHILELHEFARKHQLEIVGPGGAAGPSVYIRGIFEDRLIFICSDNQGLSLNALGDEVLCPISLLITDGKETAEGISNALTVKDAKGKQHFLYFEPIQGADGDSFLALQQSIQLGSKYLKPRTMVWTEGQVMCFYRGKIYRMSETAEDIENILRWLAGIMRTMTQNGLVIHDEEL